VNIVWCLNSITSTPDVIVGHARRYSPRVTHNHENNGKVAELIPT
jgi:hypothetical protein